MSALFIGSPDHTARRKIWIEVCTVSGASVLLTSLVVSIHRFRADGLPSSAIAVTLTALFVGFVGAIIVGVSARVYSYTYLRLPLVGRLGVALIVGLASGLGFRLFELWIAPNSVLAYSIGSFLMTVFGAQVGYAQFSELAAPYWVMWQQRRADHPQKNDH